MYIMILNSPKSFLTLGVKVSPPYYLPYQPYQLGLVQAAVLAQQAKAVQLQQLGLAHQFGGAQLQHPGVNLSPQMGHFESPSNIGQLQTLLGQQASRGQLNPQELQAQLTLPQLGQRAPQHTFPVDPSSEGHVVPKSSPQSSTLSKVQKIASQEVSDSLKVGAPTSCFCSYTLTPNFVIQVTSVSSGVRKEPYKHVKKKVDIQGKRTGQQEVQENISVEVLHFPPASFLIPDS